VTDISVVTTACVVCDATVADETVGAMHLVQIVEVEVLNIVDTTVVICGVGLPLGAVSMLVTGQVLKVVWTLYDLLV